MDAFFEEDSAARNTVFCPEVLVRHLHFLNFIEFHVNREVETQASVFRDIAPALLRLLQGIPIHKFNELNVLILPKEMSENPTYYKYTLKYLHSVLRHAESSSRQFIDNTPRG